MNTKKILLASVLMVGLASMAVFITGCGNNSDSVTGPDLRSGNQSAEANAPGSEQTVSGDRKASKMEFTYSQKRLSTNIEPGNCVFYVRTFLPSLPRNLNSMNDKRKIINTQTAKAGRAGIRNIGPVGHLFYVIKVDDSGDTQSITYREANNPYSGNWETKISVKNGKIKDIMSKYKIEGFYKG